MKKEVGGLIASTTARVARSDNDGMMTVPVQDWVQLRLNAKVHTGNLASQSFRPAPGDEVVDVVGR